MAFLAAYVAAIVLANVLLATVGTVTFLGLVIPAGTLVAGLVFTFRDLLQDALGRWWTVGGVLLGAALSAILSPELALASGLAFLASEGLDMVVYTPLRQRHWLGAVALSNTVGLVVDSALFLTLAFGSLAFLPGQLVGKGAMTALAVAVLWVWKRHQVVVA